MRSSRDTDGADSAEGWQGLADMALAEEPPLERCDRDDWLLVSFFVLVGAGLLAMSLVTGFESVLAENCTANAFNNCASGVPSFVIFMGCHSTYLLSEFGVVSNSPQ